MPFHKMCDKRTRLRALYFSSNNFVKLRMNEKVPRLKIEPSSHLHQGFKSSLVQRTEINKKEKKMKCLYDIPMYTQKYKGRQHF